MATVNFGFGSWPAFFDAAAGYRWHVGAAPNEWRGDISLGLRPRPSVLLLLQSFNILSDGSGRPPFYRFAQAKLQASLVYDLSEAWSVQIGFLTTLAGINAPAERGVVTAVWRRF